MPNINRFSVPSGVTSMKIIRNLGDLAARKKPSWFSRMWHTEPQNFSVPVEFHGRFDQSIMFGIPTLHAKVLHVNPMALAQEQMARLQELLAQNVDVDLLASPFGGYVTDYGLMSLRNITDTGVTAIAAAFGTASPPAPLFNFKYHAFGSGSTAAAETQANLVTEFTTQYAVSSTRPTGSQANTAAAGGPPEIATYVTVGTLVPTANVAVTEWGLFASATGVGAGANTMLDRAAFAVVNLVGNADSLQVTFTLSITANG